MTKPSETAVLTELRRTTLAYLSDFDFKEVEKAVERNGILSLQGSIGTIVKSAVLKHGSHNQSSHGKKGGGGSGGGGGASSESGTGTGRDDKLVEEIATDVAGLKERVEEYYNDLDDGDPDEEVIGRMSDSIDAAERNMDRAIEQTDPAKHEAFMDTARGHLMDAAVKVTDGSESLAKKFKKPIEQLADQAKTYLVTLGSD